MNFIIELEQEVDGRWIAEVINLPGVIAYHVSREDAMARAQAIAMHVEADKLENGERQSFTSGIFFRAV